MFLGAFAIADDIGALPVIVLFYAGGVTWSALAAAPDILLLAAARRATTRVVGQR